jgi:hypothetical protein
MVAYTPDGSGMAAPSTLTGAPGPAKTHADTSIVTVVMRYHAGPGATEPPPPARATIKVLVARRDGRWWVATPDAFNPVNTRRGGLTERELRADYARLRAAAR